MPSTVTQAIGLLYRMETSDVDALAGQLLEREKAAWVTALREEAQRYSMDVSPRAPSGGDLAELRALAQRDAEGIARTWNREVTAQIERIRAETPTANRNVYASRLERWATERDAHKAPSIALNTEAQTRQYAQDQFRRMNGIRAQFVFGGPPPVCAECVTLYGEGIVDEQFKDHHPAPVHPNCPHEWAPVSLEELDPAEAWVG